MKIFLIADGYGKEMAEVINKLKNFKHEVVYWVGVSTGAERNFPEIIFHNQFDARAGVPPKSRDIYQYPPPSEEIINKLLKTESLVMTMMKRQFAKMLISQSRHIYYDMLRYWLGIIKQLRPAAIVFPQVPHQVYNYLTYSLAKLLGIKIIMFEDTWVSDRALLYNDFWEGSRMLREEMNNNQGKNFNVNDFSEDLKNYLVLQQNPQHDATPIYIQRIKQSKNFKIETLIRSVRSKSILSVMRSVINSYLGPNLKKEYLALQKPPIFSKKFVYVPLHYQPERTTSPQGGVFVDQVLMIEILSHSLPKNWLIYVKEHPIQWSHHGIRYSNFRYKGYYREIARVPNVQLLPIETNTYELILKSQAVATVTGTAGWEAVIRSKPAITFGYPWYRDCPVLLRVTDDESCAKVLEQIKNGFVVDRQAVINYLKSLDNASIHCFVDNFYETSSSYSTEERFNNFVKAILQEL